jgi:DNA-directed RNA polymerase specialized sigma24 family protein
MTVNKAVVHAAADEVDELYRVHAVGLIRAALLLVGDRASAEDVVQDAFCGLYRRWDHLEDTGKARRQHQILVLRFYLDLAEDEIAATLGVSRSTVASTTSRALARLARDLREEQ